MTTMLLGLLGVLVGAAVGWRVALAMIPRRQTDRLFAKFLSLGMKTNILSPGFVRTAKSNDVPCDNADTMTRVAMLDVSGGPLVFEARVPEGVEYWSVSVFAHDGDTVYCANDSELGTGAFRLGIALKDQAPVGGCRAQASLPSGRGFLIIRLVLPDRSDRASNSRLKALISDAEVRSA